MERTLVEAMLVLLVFALTQAQSTASISDSNGTTTVNTTTISATSTPSGSTASNGTTFSTTTRPSNTSTTATTESQGNTTVMPTTTTAPSCSCASFSVGSFFGGMALSVALVVIGFILFKYCRHRRNAAGTNYSTF